eukprot:COSAG06_NODE_498_length_15000_cov_60.875721_12_plen_72_part_00
MRKTPFLSRFYFENDRLAKTNTMLKKTRFCRLQNVEAAYQNVTKHESWSIPWLEDDSAMNGVQLWCGKRRF